MFGLKNDMMVATAVLICAAPMAQAGNGAGNGGGAWVCRESGGSIRFSQVVDLFEAESEYGLTLFQYPGQVRDIVDQVQMRIFKASPALLEGLSPYIDKVAYLNPNPPNITYTEDVLKVIDDSLYRLEPSPKRCQGGTIRYEQVVNYKNDGLILLQSEIFNSLSNSAKAALVLHEALYAYRRKEAGDKDSVATRRIIGLIFSTLSIEDLKKELEKQSGFSDGPLGTKFVQLNSGLFTMGSPKNEAGRGDYETPHLVHVDGFEMQTHEVTQAQWLAVMGENPSKYSQPENCPSNHKVTRGIAICPNHPVEQVSYNDVTEFLAKLNLFERDGYRYRLPTESEWEYAARAGTASPYFFGTDPGKLNDYAWNATNARGQTQPVATLKPNPWGLYDMYGNVGEWVYDWWNTDYNGSTPSSSRVIRGGGPFETNSTSYRSAQRWGSYPQYGLYICGFRLVRTR